MSKNLSISSADKIQGSTSLLPSAIASATLIFYILFTLLPNSNSLMVKWPWVFLWQFGLMLGPIALLSQLWQQSFRRLGGWLDWLAGGWCLVLILSAAFAQFPHQAFWYGWAAICGIAFLYALNIWLVSPNRVRHLLIFQGGLSIIVSGLSLLSWFFQTVRPYQHTLEQLKSYGIERSFDLQILTLRNWYPIGHQNYVAGYLLLSLPLVVGLAFSQTGWRRVGWLGGFALGLATLYSTASRGSWFGLVISTLVFIGLSAWQYPKLRRLLFGTGLVSFGAIALWALSSDRLRSLFTSLFTHSAASEPTYRLITNATGWQIGLDHPILGAGLGSVALLYQKYRPAWAGREAELTYQLHSTPAQLWAELGLAGAVLALISILAVSYLGWRWCKTLVASASATPVIGILSGLAGYSLYALTDYQLDNICISGTLIIFVAVLIFENTDAEHSKTSHPLSLRALSPAPPNLGAGGPPGSTTRSTSSVTVYKRIALVGAGILTAVSLWLYPIHRAWMLSSQGFLALQQDDFASFVTYLEKAHQLAPWEPYYAHQLAWNIGELAYSSKDAQQQESLRQESIQWFNRANSISPHQEFGYANLGWLQVNSEPHAATQSFRTAAQLVPGKRGAFFALGYSLLKENKPEEALQAMVKELMQQPILITSPIWQSPELVSFYPQVVASFENELTQQLTKASTESSKSHLYQILGSLNWWQGNFDKARTAFEKVPTPLNQTMLALAETRPGEKVAVEVSEESAAGSAIAAWQNPQESDRYLTQALLISTDTGIYPPTAFITSLVDDLSNSMATSSTFHEWLTKAASRSNRNQRLGFGTISRHIDGSLPNDFSPQIESTGKVVFLEPLFPGTPMPAVELTEKLTRISKNF
jgi:uncharacterized protein involved in response to NO